MSDKVHKGHLILKTHTQSKWVRFLIMDVGTLYDTTFQKIGFPLLPQASSHIIYMANRIYMTALHIVWWLDCGHCLPSLVWSYIIYGHGNTVLVAQISPMGATHFCFLFSCQLFPVSCSHVTAITHEIRDRMWLWSLATEIVFLCTRHAVPVLWHCFWPNASYYLTYM